MKNLPQKINLLPSELYNKIAAGEVVERPASVVKELLENSIDAGATQIVIEAREGGTQYIRVSDNGCGIAQDDVELAFMPHATSKIKTVADLEKIQTLGFRGEALASIASISKVTLTTKTQNDDTATSFILAPNQNKKIQEKNSETGTTIIIEDLFFNVPARRKFLKTQKTEEDEISNIVSRFILANPSLSFKYILNNKEYYNFSGTGLADAIYLIYGRDTVDNLLQIDSQTVLSSHIEGITLYGYIGNPNIAKNNKSYQTLIVNGRYVLNTTVSAAIGRVFENYLMKGKYPFYVLHLTIDPSKIDVNVHPAKTEIKFEENQTVFQYIYHICNHTILNATSLANQAREGELIKTESVYTPLQNNQLIQNVKNNFARDFNFNIPKEDTLILKSPSAVEIINTIQMQENPSEKKPEQIFALDEAFKPIGSLFNTYIIIEAKDTVYFIDEHAAHEHFIYEKLSKQENLYKNKQQLLIPYILNVNHKENSFIESNLKAFTELGFIIESFGKLTYKIEAVPAILTGVNLKNLFSELLADDFLPAKTKDIVSLKEKIKQQACKAAVKAGEKLEQCEVSELIFKISSTQKPLLCPHGRPIVISYTKKDIEKWFKRII